jgi:hypothetical protein
VASMPTWSLPGMLGWGDTEAYLRPWARKGACRREGKLVTQYVDFINYLVSRWYQSTDPWNVMSRASRDIKHAHNQSIKQKRKWTLPWKATGLQKRFFKSEVSRIIIVQKYQLHLIKHRSQIKCKQSSKNAFDKEIPKFSIVRYN